MKIMIFNTLYFPYRIGGAEVSVQLLAEELALQGHIVRVVSLTEGGQREVTMLNGVELIKLPLSNIYWPFSNENKSFLKKAIWHLFDYLNVKMYFKALREIKAFSPDIVHTNNISGFSVLLWKAVKKCNVRLIHTSRDYYLFHPNSTLFSHGQTMSSKDKSIVFWSAIKRVYSRNVDEYVGISQFIQKQHYDSDFFKKSGHHVIYNAVSKIDSGKVKDIKRIGFIGRLSIEKGFDVFCNIAGENKIKYSFIAAGNFINNEEQQSLIGLANKSDVTVKGFMKLDDFLNQVDAVVLPIKWNEPFGRTVVECVLADKLVLTNPVGAMTELSMLLPNIIITDNIERDFADKMVTAEIKAIDSSLIERFKPREIADQYLCVYNGKMSV
ncbi:glycosyltransferase family 4 protein [Rahnella woolbedingensis]|uniref:Glycosyltransferase n=1 Tax=Rahnella woolbedingensis TaxID=1510574 RepID=A0A419N2Y5_9GAMM|nr:glycosyltransferase family 4 protein [Rahnella woolbedingensis]RJT35163.1 glycosyltransferase [Rahnella woolbedingensis]